jgi:hypothetical protein
MKDRISEFIYPPSIQRCQHIKVNGIQCGSPALKTRKLCHFHQRWCRGRIQINANRARRARFSIDLPILEDANSIQVALMQTIRLLLTNQIDHRTAALLFYGLQTASTNLRHTKFEPRPERVVIDPNSVAETSLGDKAWYKEEFEAPEEEKQETQKDGRKERQKDARKERQQEARKEAARAKAKPATVAEVRSEISALIQKSFDLNAMARPQPTFPHSHQRPGGRSLTSTHSTKLLSRRGDSSYDPSILIDASPG